MTAKTYDPDTLTVEQMESMSDQELVDFAADHPGAAVEAPSSLQTEIYWDADRAAPAVRIGKRVANLEHAGWSDDPEFAGVSLTDFFDDDDDGRYYIPTWTAAHPLFRVIT